MSIRLRLACTAAALSATLAIAQAHTSAAAAKALSTIEELSPKVAAELNATPSGATAEADAAALIAAWHDTADGNDFRALQSAVDKALGAHQPPAANALLEVYHVTNQAKYRAAAEGAAKAEDAPHAAAPDTDAARLLAAVHTYDTAESALGRGKRVAVDAWFNSQTRTAQNGQNELFHYKWTDEQNSGFRFFARAFEHYGATLATIAEAPSATNLKGVSVFVVPSPDIPAKNPHPHYMDKASGDAIEAWVKAGGVLLLMENDKTNSEFEHFNTLSERFGIHFNPVLRNTVEGNHFEQGRLDVPAGTGGIFPEARQVYMKEICTITTSGPAKAIFTDKGDTLMAVAHVGKGTVYAVVDPWLYNEYTDGRKLPAEYKNFAAAMDLARWSLEQAK